MTRNIATPIAFLLVAATPLVAMTLPERYVLWALVPLLGGYILIAVAANAKAAASGPTAIATPSTSTALAGRRVVADSTALLAVSRSFAPLVEQIEQGRFQPSTYDPRFPTLLGVALADMDNRMTPQVLDNFPTLRKRKEEMQLFLSVLTTEDRQVRLIGCYADLFRLCEGVDRALAAEDLNILTRSMDQVVRNVEATLDKTDLDLVRKISTQC